MVEQGRLATHDAVAAKLSALSDSGLRTLLDAGTAPRFGIGGATQSIEVDGLPVFAKAIKLSDLEFDAGPGDTRNLFALPPWYHYGVGEGSTGFNAWREVATHEMVSDLVALNGRGSFPLLYHWRIMRNLRREFAEAEIARAVKFWRNSGAVEARLRALSEASMVVVLFTEHIPLTLRGWLNDQLDSNATEMVVNAVGELVAAAKQMRAHGLVHFDAHLDNILTTGQHLVVSDFGLAAASDFQLDDAEGRFLAMHSDHDVAHCAAELSNAILGKFIAFPDVPTRNAWMQRCALTGVTEGVPAPFAETIRRLAPTSTLMNKFYWQLHGGHLETEFPSTAVAAALHEVTTSA
ncbi:hypothetical protein ACXPWS_12050 [Mycobacterium sp. BMJ-28]